MRPDRFTSHVVIFPQTVISDTCKGTRLVLTVSAITTLCTNHCFYMVHVCLWMSGSKDSADIFKYNVFPMKTK